MPCWAPYRTGASFTSWLTVVLTRASELGVVLHNDQTLSVADLPGVNLDADLVVLSAGDTGAGRLTEGGEVLGSDGHSSRRGHAPPS